MTQDIDSPFEDKVLKLMQSINHINLQNTDAENPQLQ